MPRTARNMLPDDGLIDEVAVTLAVTGARVVALTPAERDLAVHRMIARGADVAELAAHLGTSYAAASRAAVALGYRLSRPDNSGHRWILPPAEVPADQAAHAQAA
jgi:hypothetical protein